MEENGILTEKKSENGDVSEGKTEAQSVEMISKEMFDKKISEINQQKKALKAELDKRMTDDERMAAEQAERNAELQKLKNELAALKTESALIAAGIDSENAGALSAAIIGGDAAAIVEAVKTAVTAAEKSAAAKTAKELLEGGAPRVQTATGSAENPGARVIPDPMAEIVKKAVASNAPATSKKDSSWFK